MDGPRKPGWWKKNEASREEMNLPEYEPPKFLDDTFVFNTLNNFDEMDIQFLRFNPQEREGWDVRVNNEKAFDIESIRDKQGNIVFQMISKEFVNKITTFMADE